MFRWVDHTSEVELELECASEEEVFHDALRAVADLLGTATENEPGSSVQERVVEVEGTDRARLLAAWLSDLAFLAEAERFVPERAEDLRLSDDRLRARVLGRPGDPPHLIKAVTFHRLAFEPAGNGWRARVILDV